MNRYTGLDEYIYNVVGGKMKTFAKNHPVLTYWLISVILAGFLIPIGLWLSDRYPTSIEEMQRIGGRITTNILYEFPRVLRVEGGIAWMLLFMAQPAMPLVAALITAALIGQQRMQDLVSRWRFWSKDVGWKKGVLIWLAAIASFTIVVNLGTAILAYMNKSPFTWPDFKFIADPLSPTFWFLFLTSLFFDGGGLLEETGWRGFALPEMQKKYTPLKAAIGLGVLWSLWHIPVKVEELMDDLPRFLYFYTCFTLSCILLSIIISYFYNKLGGSTLIAIALHGLSNDSSGITGGFSGIGGNLINTLEAAKIFDAMALVPLLILAVVILWLDAKWLGLGVHEQPVRQHGINERGGQPRHPTDLISKQPVF